MNKNNLPPLSWLFEPAPVRQVHGELDNTKKLILITFTVFFTLINLAATNPLSLSLSKYRTSVLNDQEPQGEKERISNTLLVSLSNHAPVGVEERALPDDISCCIADLKFDGERIYICEFGEGIESRFKGYSSLYGHGAMWHTIWQTLSFFGMPMHYVGTELASPRKDFAYNTFKRYLKNVHTTIADFETHYQAVQLKRAKKIPQRELLVVHTLKQPAKQVHELHVTYPALLFLGKATSRYVRSKQATNTLFDIPFLKQFKPATLEIEKRYSPELAQTIMQAIPSDFYVIKPPHCALGQGVILLPKAALDTTLRLIMQVSKQLSNMGDKKAYAYWLHDASASVIIEAFKPSKTIVVEDRPYDATMRAVFIMSNLNGIMKIQHLGAYWKLPLKSLLEDGTFMELHKSAISHRSNASAMVDEYDYKKVREQLDILLPLLYQKMLIKSTII
ncbi:hypothetical protein FJ365_05365 [Candidatus Dependentiae bacterium]|nr:hypothetical protein [Candidatus Dependentiae bacterium]